MVELDSIRNKNILVVDDFQGDCIKVEKFLTSSLDPSVVVAHETDSELAVQKIAKYHYDLVILDNLMPNISGLEIAKFIKALNKGKDDSKRTNIIFVSVSLEHEHAVAAIDMGVKLILVKPFTKEQLMVKLREAFTF